MKAGIKIFLTFIIASGSLFAQESNVLTAFNAGYFDNEFLISWTVSNPDNISKFVVEKQKVSQNTPAKICEVPFNSFRNKTQTESELLMEYVCSDEPEENGVYYFTLTIIDNTGSPLGSPFNLKVGITEVPEFKLHQNNPNPFNPSTEIRYEVLVPTNIKLSVFTLTGQLVDVLVDGLHAQGNYSVNFNTTNYSELASGIYFFKLESEYSTDIRKMIFAK